MDDVDENMWKGGIVALNISWVASLNLYVFCYRRRDHVPKDASERKRRDLGQALLLLLLQEENFQPATKASQGLPRRGEGCDQNVAPQE